MHILVHYSVYVCMYVCVNRDLASTGVAKKGKTMSPIDSAKNLVRSRLDFGYQYHTSCAVNEFLRVPSPAPGIMPNALAHSGSS